MTSSIRAHIASAGILFVLASLMMLATVHAADPPGTYTAAGTLAVGRSDHTATVLVDGRIFIAGGTTAGGMPSASTEIYDPATGATTAMVSMTAPRSAHTATLLPDGRVLLAGGLTSGFSVSVTAEIYDPATDTLSSAPDMTEPRASHTATLLSTGDVLVAGGFIGTGATTTVELFDGSTWTSTGALNESRDGHNATLLADGRVLITAGQGDFPELRDSAEIYDPIIGTFSLTGSLGVARWWHSATLLSDGRVLIAGGNTDFASGVPTASVERFDPATGLFTSVGSLSATRAQHTASLLPDDTVLMFGGGSTTPERWDTTTGSGEPAGDPISGGRIAHTASPTGDGAVAIIGGASPSGSPLASIERYEPGVEGTVEPEGSEPGDSATLPDGISLSTAVIDETIVLDGVDLTFADLASGLAVMIPLSSLPSSSPSVSVSLTPVADLGSLATIAPPPAGGSFVLGGAVVLDTFLDGTPSGPFAEPGFVSATIPLAIDPATVGVFAFEPTEFSVAQADPDVPWVEIAAALVEFDGQTVTWPVNGPGLFALVSFPPSELPEDDPTDSALQLAASASANFWIWTAGEISAADLFENANTLVVAWRWNGAGWDAFNPSLPVAVTVNFTLGLTAEPDILWIITSGPLSVFAPAGGPPPLGATVSLATGATANFVTWHRGATTASELFGQAVNISVVWRWNGSGWDAFNPALPVGVSTDFALGVSPQPDLLWLVSTAAVTVTVPS